MILLSFHIFTFAQYNAPYFQIGQTNTHQVIPIETLFRSDTTLTLQDNIDIYGLSISGDAIMLDDKSSYVRVTMTDQYNIEHLVYETYSLLADDEIVEFSNVAMETSLLDGVKPQSLTISLENAYLRISNIIYQLYDISNGDYIEMKRAYGQMQNSYIIDLLNEKLEAKGELWRAGETTISKMSYDDKKDIFCNVVPKLYGMEYYKSGIFLIPNFDVDEHAEIASLDTLNFRYVKEWDWRNRHNINWTTPVRINQGGCGSCWAFAAVANIESKANIYYNRSVNFDLSEQQVVSCYSNDGCNGGNVSSAFTNINKYGIVSEDCFPYVGRNDSCVNMCNNPTNKVRIAGLREINKIKILPSTLKKHIINNPLTLSIKSWQHAMELIGYKELCEGDSIATMLGDALTVWINIDSNHVLKGQTAWLIKNSWGMIGGIMDMVILFPDGMI